MNYTLLIKNGCEYLVDKNGKVIAKGFGSEGKLDAEDVLFALGIIFNIEENDDFLLTSDK